MKKIMHIVKGWAKAFGVINVSLAEKKLSVLRLKICKGCDKSTESKVIEIINGNAIDEHSLKCTMCGCPCLEKSLVVDEQCPLHKW
jgi:hypothetical protein